MHHAGGDSRFGHNDVLFESSDFFQIRTFYRTVLVTFIPIVSIGNIRHLLLRPLGILFRIPVHNVRVAAGIISCEFPTL